MQTTTYKLNVTPGGVPLTIHISQYDVGLRQYIFQPYTSEGEFTYVSGATVTLEATKPDGYAVIHNCTYNQDGSIAYTVQEQLAAKAGRVWSKVVIRNGNNVLGTGAVLWIVDYAGVKDNAIISDSDISGLEGYVDQMKTLVSTPIAVTTAAGMTDHEKLYLYEGSETGYTAGDWYYWDGSAWTSGGEYGSGAVEIDPTLSIAGEAADAKATGDGLAELKNDLETFENALGYSNGPQVPDEYFTLTNVGKDLNYLGQLTDNSAVDSSDYIEITDDLYDICRVVPNTTKYGMSSICYYASDKSFIRRDLPGTNYDFSTFGGQTVVWFNIDKTTPGIKYVRFNTEVARGFNYWVVYDASGVEAIEDIQEDISEIKEVIGFEVAPIAPSDYLAMIANTGLNYLGQAISDNGQEASDYISLDNLYDVCRVVQNKTKYGLGSICYYSSTKNFIQRVQPGTSYEFSIFNGETVAWLSIDKTISNAAYIRFCGDNDKSFKYWAVEYGNKASALDDYSKLPFYGKKIVNFGDSIFGQTRPPKDVSSYLAGKTGATVYNCGFGGCEMSDHADSNYNPFSMCNLATAIATNTWTTQEAAASASGMPTYFPEALTLLKSIDFSTVDIVTIAYGTNDWNNGTPLDNGGNSDTTYFADALRYSIETLLTAYPNLRIFVCTQTYRFWTNSGTFVDDSNTHVNTQGEKLTDFVAKTIEVAEEYQLPYIDNYEIGMNKYNRAYYFYTTDSTHPKPEGNQLIADNIANKIY